MFENSLKALIITTFVRAKNVSLKVLRQYPILVRNETFLGSFQPLCLCDYRSPPHFVCGNPARWTENFAISSTKRSCGIYPECQNVVVCCCCCCFLTTRSSSSSSCLGPKCPDFMVMTAKDKLLSYIWIYCRIRSMYTRLP